MDVEAEPKLSPSGQQRILLVINCILLVIGTSGGPLITRLYFIHGGKRVWFSSRLETAGWPIFFLPLTVTHFRQRCSQQSNPTQRNRFFFVKPPMFFAFVVVGTLTGFDDYFYAYGVGNLPVSTYSLIIATQLAFTACFAFLLVKHKFTPFSINAVVLLTVGAAVLAMHTSTDKPENESNKEYILGFVLTLVASALYGFVLPLAELSYKKARNQIGYALILETQIVMCLFATGVCTIGMLVNKDFQAISREAKMYELAETKYYLVVVFIAMAWQCFFLGAIGVVYYASSLFSGIVIAAGIPVTEILAVIFYKEKFQPEKGVALALSLWGFASYFYGEIRNIKRQKQTTRETEMQQVSNGDS